MQNKYLTFLNLQKRPFEIFALMAVLLFITSFVPSSKSVDINLMDTYFVVSINWLFKPLATGLLVIWLIYIFTNSMLLSLKLTWVHIIMSTVAIAILLIAITFNMPYSTAPTRYYAFVEPESAKNWNFMYAALFTILFVAQLVFVVNILGGIFKRIRLFY
jgi:heme/copper-type cytochrome/quinol oxidase subunit 1